VAQKIDATTGQIVPAIIWSAQSLLDAKVSLLTDSRTIYKFDAAGTNNLKPFLWANLSSGAVGAIAAEQPYFANQCTALSQCAGLTVAQKLLANDGANMVNFLRGQKGNEATLYRLRDHTLGDSVNATPAFVRVPPFGFVDVVTPTYGSFKSTNASRQGVLYVAANDGMLHAFNGNADNTGGGEMWAYIPRMVFPNLKDLASDNWSSGHKYSVDGSPQTMDVYDSGAGAWRTILVGGLNKGGRGFYALDVTTPGTPKGLWEFCSDSTLCAISDTDLGLSYGNALITKRASDDRWVVMVTSGMNNVSPGTGRGFLYVLDALTGAILQKIDTGAGDATTPSGFSKIAGYANSFSTNNTADFVYGGDLLGNVWRFDMSVAPVDYPTVQTTGVLKLATLTDSSGKPQSITTRPELGAIQGFRAIFIGTGRYLGVNDLSDPADLIPAEQWAYQQSFYAIKDDNRATTFGDLRSPAQLMVQQTISDTLGVRTTSNNAVDWNTKNGWYVDFNPGGTSPGERVSLDPQLIQGTLLVTTNVPNNNACTVGGDSFPYQFDYIKGSYVSTSPGNVVATKITGQITVGIVVVRLPDGTFKAERTGSPGTHDTLGVNIGTGGNVARRVSWRELFQLQ
jgi:type IV pilus assembly protein PilY1